MRNLKRALSLALASIMIIGMMVTGAGAAFSDQETIKNAEAVDVVSVLGIINGLPGGVYGPEQLVDRASMTKMITLALNGGIEPVLGTKDKATYSDIKGTWAESFIEYCSNQGIVAGDGKGAFNPTGSVTGSQAAKMLLVALGYDSIVFGFTGANWEINVSTEANKAGIYAGMTGLQASAPLSRDNAAQMIFNALNSKVMDRTPHLDVTTGNISYNYDIGEKTMLEIKFGAVRLTGVATANEVADLSSATALAAGKTEIVLDTNTSGLSGTQTFNVTTDLDVLGKSVSFFVKVDATKTASKSTVIGTPTVNSNNKVTVLDTDKTATAMPNYLSDNKLTLNGNTLYSTNYATASNANSAIADSNAAGVILTFIDNNNDNKVDYVVRFTQTFGEVTNYNTAGKGSISVSPLNRHLTNTTLPSLTNSNAKEDIGGFADVAKGDYVLFYSVGGASYVKKLTGVDATISSIRGAKIVADGVTYSQSGLVTGVDGNNALLAAAVNGSIGKTVKLFLDDAGNVLRVADADSTTNYLFVEAADPYSNVSGYSNTRIVLADATTALVRAYVTTTVAGVTTKTAPAANTIYTYSVNSDETYELRAIGSKFTTDSANEIKKGNVALVGADASTIANANTVFVVKPLNSNSYTLYKGIANVPSMTGVVTGVYKNNVNASGVTIPGGTFEIVFVTGSSISGNNKNIYAITGAPTVTKDGTKTIYTYDVVFEGKYQQLTGGSNEFSGLSGLYNNVAVNGTEITGSGVHAGHGAKATQNSGGTIANGGQIFTHDSKTVFVLIDQDGETADEMAQIVDIGSVVIDTVNSSNTSVIAIVAGTNSRATVAEYVYILN